MGIPEEGGGKREKTFEGIITENFTKLMSDTESLIQDT